MKALAQKLLKKSEKYTRTDMSYLVGGGFWLTTSKVVAALTSLVTSIFFANYLSPDTYGQFRYILSFFVMFSIFSLSGVDTALIKAIAKGHAATTKAAIFTKLRFGLIGSLSGVILSIYYFTHENTVFGVIFLLGAIIAPLMETAYIYVSHLNGNKDFFRTSLYASSTRIITAVLIVGTLLITQNLIYIVLTYLLSHLLLRALFLFLSLRKYSWVGETDTESIDFGKHLTVNQGAIQIAGNLDKIMVFIFVGPATLAGYYLAMVPFKQLKSILSSISSLALPKFAQKNSYELGKILPRIMIFLYMGLVPIIVIYWLIADTLFTNLLPLYTEYAMLSKIIVLLLLLYPIDLLQTALTALNAKKEIYYITITTSVVRAILLFIAIPLYGMWGAVAVVITTQILNAILKVIFFVRHFRSPHNRPLLQDKQQPEK